MKKADKIKESCKGIMMMMADKTTSIIQPAEKLQRMLAEWIQQKFQCTIVLSKLSQRASLMSWMLLTRIWKSDNLIPVLGGLNSLNDTMESTIFKRWGLPIHWLGAFRFCTAVCPAWACSWYSPLRATPGSTAFFLCGGGINYKNVTS